MQFLKQIPYIADWAVRETQAFYLLCKEVTAELNGTIIAQEGQKC